LGKDDKDEVESQVDMKRAEDRGTLAAVELYLLVEEEIGRVEGAPDVCWGILRD
jgi:hypothetical protein